MPRRFVMYTIAAALAWPGALVAQEEPADEGTPPMLMISSWKCNWSDMEAIGDDWSESGIKAARSAIDNGLWGQAGVFYHAWADEWNVHYWATGKDIPALIEGQEASNAAYEEMYGEGLSLWDHCSEHKDSFYWEAQYAGGGTEPPGPEMAISSWKCTDVSAVNQAWEDYYRPKAQAVVDSGQWSEAGVFYHAWASEWNVNFYYIGEDIPAILAGWDAYIESMGDDAPDIAQWCSEHRDGFYTFGPTARASEQEMGD